MLMGHVKSSVACKDSRTCDPKPTFVPTSYLSQAMILDYGDDTKKDFQAATLRKSLFQRADKRVKIRSKFVQIHKLY